MEAQRDFRATWSQASLTLFGPLLLFFGLRWLVGEPFVIPSGSMLPTLHIHDHILTNKLAYGIHVPFSRSWIVQWDRPKRGDIVVFRYPENPEVFYVKRAIGVPGDHITLEKGVLKINGLTIPLKKHSAPRGFEEDGFDYYLEEGHLVRYMDRQFSDMNEIIVPQGHFFVLGDNRDQSNDSRVWGFVPDENLVGKSWLVWLGCDSTLSTAQFLCDPMTLRWDRFLIRTR